jgi:hypothetical protein
MRILHASPTDGFHFDVKKHVVAMKMFKAFVFSISWGFRVFGLYRVIDFSSLFGDLGL